MTKLFIGAISVDTTEDMLRNHFEQYGSLTDCKLMMDTNTGRNRGFAFVTYANADDAAAVLEKNHSIDNREMDCKRAISKEAMDRGGERGPGGRPEGGNERGGGPSRGERPGRGVPGPGTTPKLFVGGLPSSCSQENLRTYFEKYGSVKDSIVMLDRESNRHRGFGFVEFDAVDSADAVMDNINDHYIDEKWIEVKRAVPRGADASAYLALGSRPPRQPEPGRGPQPRGGPQDPYAMPRYAPPYGYNEGPPPYGGDYYSSYPPPYPPHYPPPHGYYPPPQGYYGESPYDPAGGYPNPPDPYGPYNSNPYAPAHGEAGPPGDWGESAPYYGGEEGGREEAAHVPPQNRNDPPGSSGYAPHRGGNAPASYRAVPY